MEVLARYCSIPGYKKLCCESCSKRSGTLPPSFFSEAAETEEDVVINPADVPKTLATPSLVPPRFEPIIERQGSLGRMTSREEDTHAGVPRSYNRARVADLSPGRGQNHARNKSSESVVMPSQPPTESGHLMIQNSSALSDIVPLVAHGNFSIGVPSPHRTSRKTSKQVERRPSPRTSTVERWKKQIQKWGGDVPKSVPFVLWLYFRHQGACMLSKCKALNRDKKRKCWFTSLWLPSSPSSSSSSSSSSILVALKILARS